MPEEYPVEESNSDIIAEQLGEEAAIPWHCEDCGATWEASLSEFPDKAHCPECKSVHIY